MFFAVFFALVGLTAANQAEMVTLGVISDAGVDFFSLFSSEEEGSSANRQVTAADIKERWDKIDIAGEGIVTSSSVQRFIMDTKKISPIKRLIFSLKTYFYYNENFTSLAILIITVAFLKGSFLFFSKYSSRVFSIRISKELRRRYFSHVQNQSMDFFHNYDVGTLSSRVSGDAMQISSSIHSLLVNYFLAPVTILSTLGVCLWISWQLSAVVFLGVPLVVLPIVLLSRRVRRESRKLQKHQEKCLSVLVDFFEGHETIKAFSMEFFSLKKYCKFNDRIAHLEKKSAKYDFLTRPILHSMATCCMASIVLVGIHFMDMRISEIIIFGGLMQLFYEPVKVFAEENANIQKGVVAIDRMGEILSSSPTISDSEDAQDLLHFERLDFEDVWFKYPSGDRWVLKAVTFSIKRGDSFAVIGKTGIGKSTLIQLIIRLYEPQRGEIKINGIPLAQYSQRSIRKNIAIVPQNPFIFYDTVAANIVCGADSTPEEIITASKMAGAHGFISKLPDGYNTVLTEKGDSLSGGEKQRLSIARALFKGGLLQILDEATSALDVVSEKEICERLGGNNQMTRIIISHRFSAIKNIDNIMYFAGDGNIIVGSRREVLEQSEEFRALCSSMQEDLNAKISPA